ncbi:MAG: hypothetical protein N2Z81_04905 [Hydrogenothermaceae bacterium]|nr:hypothetical protein [Hydrogenothermaceae bacterium]
MILKQEKLIIFLFFLFFTSSPFYLWESGFPQIYHIIGFVFFVLTLFNNINKQKFISEYKVVLLFVFYVSGVNLTFFLLYKKASFLLSSLYYIYNVCILFATVSLEKYIELDVQKFFRKIYNISIMLLTLEIFMILFGFNKFMYDGNRFTGTFNDPNQFGHFTIWISIIALLSNKISYNKWSFNIIVISLLIITTIFNLSRSTTLAVFMIIIYIIFDSLVRLKKQKEQGINLQKFKKSNIVIINLIIFMLFYLLIENVQKKINLAEYMQFYIDRIEEAKKKNIKNFEERGYDRLIKFPQYLLFGSGEGFHERWKNFDNTIRYTVEIHSTFAGILFYYGIIGLSLFFYFIIKIFRNIKDLLLKFLFMAPFLYSISTYNSRNTMFWIGISFFILYSKLSRLNKAKNGS